jgi:hypothetical protein
LIPLIIFGKFYDAALAAHSKLLSFLCQKCPDQRCFPWMLLY